MVHLNLRMNEYHGTRLGNDCHAIANIRGIHSRITKEAKFPSKMECIHNPTNAFHLEKLF
jgi:hypothetical protein